MALGAVECVVGGHPKATMGDCESWLTKLQRQSAGSALDLRLFLQGDDQPTKERSTSRYVSSLGTNSLASTAQRATSPLGIESLRITARGGPF